jgi:hypothetical protein
MPRPLQEFSLVALPVLVDHHSVTQLVLLEPSLEGPSFVEFVMSQHFLVVSPISSELIAVGVLVVSLSIAFAILDSAVVVLLV